MEKLISDALAIADEAEVLLVHDTSRTLSFSEGKWSAEASSKTLAHLRLLREEQLASATTTTLEARQRLLRTAEELLQRKRPGPRSFAPLADAVAPAVELPDWNQANPLQEIKEVVRRLSAETRQAVSASATCRVVRMEFLNSLQQRFACASAQWFLSLGLLGDEADSMSERKFSPADSTFDEGFVSSFLEFHRACAKSRRIRSGMRPVLLLPEALFFALYRFAFGANGQNHVHGGSRIRSGERVISPSLTLYNDPTDGRFALGQPWDDEGIPTRRQYLFKEGIFQEPFCDLQTAHALGRESTGNGFRSAAGEGDVLPAVNHLVIPPGSDTLSSLLERAEGGLLVSGTLGDFSGNIAQGDFSVSACQGFLVEGGRISGVLKDVLLSGNVYDAFSDIGGIGDTPGHICGARVPPILLNRVSVVQG